MQRPDTVLQADGYTTKKWTWLP